MQGLIRIIFALLVLLNFAFSLELLRLSEFKGQNVSGWLASEKLDGVRAYWDGENLLSRQGKKLNAPLSFLKISLNLHLMVSFTQRSLNLKKFKQV